MGGIMETRQLYRALFEVNRRLTELTISVQDVLTILQGEMLTEESLQHSFDQQPTEEGKHPLDETTDEQKFVDERNEIIVSLLNRQGDVPGTSRLNMGFSDYFHNHQAAILIEPPNWSFFPDPQITFNVTTDDGKTLIMKTTGDRSRLLVTVGNYRILSQYIRDRLGISLETRITRTILDDYGRTDITFRRQDGKYLLDFST